jgi:hypothetical protein
MYVINVTFMCIEGKGKGGCLLKRQGCIQGQQAILYIDNKCVMDARGLYRIKISEGFDWIDLTQSRNSTSNYWRINKEND